MGCQNWTVLKRRIMLSKIVTNTFLRNKDHYNITFANNQSNNLIKLLCSSLHRL